MATIRAGDINLEYYVEGSGPPLLMIMGHGGQALSWSERFLDLLRPHFTCIRFSNRGTGTSDRVDEATTIEVMARDTVNLLDALSIERPHVFGVSMGGMIAQAIVLDYPGRVNGLVLGCTLSSLPRGVLPDPEVMGAFAPVPGMTREEQIRKVWPAICAPSFIEQSSVFLEEMLVLSLRNPTPMETIIKQGMAVNAFDAYDRLPEIAAPTLVIHGDADRLVPIGNGQILAQGIPGAEFRVLTGAAHMFFWEQPEESAKAVVEFLSGVPVAR